MNIFSAFDTSVMVALLLGIEFLRSDIRTILYCKRNDPWILKSCLYTLLILLTSLYSIVVGAMLHPEPVNRGLWLFLLVYITCYSMSLS